MSGDFFASSGVVVRLPDASEYDHLVESLEHARERLWIEIYTWTDLVQVTDAVIQAHAR